MLLSYFLFSAAALMWPLRSMIRSEGVLLPFLSALMTGAGVIAGLVGGASLSSLALGPMAVLLAALLLPEGGGKR